MLTSDFEEEAFAAATASERPVVLAHTEDAYGWIVGAREYYANLLDYIYGDESPLAKALLIGNRTELTRAELQNFSGIGVMHIFAVSGMHMTALIGAVGILYRKKHTWMGFAIAAMITVLYCTLTSFTPAVMRAGCFLLVLLLSGLWRRQSEPLSAYLLSLAVVLLIRPYSLYSASFLLSFGAMAGILFLQPTIEDKLLFIRSSTMLRAAACAISVIITVLPISVYFFGGVAWMTVPASVLLAPLLPVFLPFAFLSLLIAPALPLFAKALATPAYGVLLLFDKVTDLVRGELLPLPVPHVAVLPFWYLGSVFCSPYFLPNRKHPPWIGLGLLAVALVLWMVI